MQISIKSKDIKKNSLAYQEQIDRIVEMCLFVDRSVNVDVVSKVRNLFLSKTNNVNLSIEYFDNNKKIVASSFDFAIILSETSTSTLELFHDLNKHNTPAFIVTENIKFLMDLAKESKMSLPAGDILAVSKFKNDNYYYEEKRLAEWIIAVCPDKKYVIAKAFPFVARPLANDIVQLTSIQNGLIGAIPFLKSADFPIMIGNQVKMLIQISAIYGEVIDENSIKEISAVLVAGFLSRSVAKKACKFLPLPRLAIKSSIGWGGTRVIGEGLIVYFSNGGNAKGVLAIVQKLSNVSKKSIDVAKKYIQFK